MNNNILVSICCITYNQAPFIRQCIEGFLMQECRFNFEILIHDDASTDGTREIIEEYQNRYPHIIKPFFQTENQYSKGVRGINIKYNFSRAQGKYLAICDGDDYWINKNKLQSQVDFLEQNSDYSICCHNFKILDGNNLLDNSFLDKIPIKENSTIEDLSKNNIIGTLTAVFRKEEIEFPLWTQNAPLGDLILFLNIAQNGKIKYFNEKWAVYRQNVGVWHQNKNNHESMVHLYSNLANDYKHLPIVHHNLNKIKKKYIKALLKKKSFFDILKSPYFQDLSFSEKCKIIIFSLIF